MKYLKFIIFSFLCIVFFACSDDIKDREIYEANKIIPDTTWFWQGIYQTYTISTPEELAGLSILVKNGNRTRGKTFILGNDISFNSKSRSAGIPKYEWTPIGINTDKSFSGTFDGNGYVIRGIYIYSKDLHLGFFGWVEEGAVIKNLGLEDLHVDGSARYVGGLVGTLRRAVVQNCYTKGEVKGNFRYTGGLVGYNDGGNIVNSYADTKVSGISHVGGLTGANLGLVASIVNSYSIGEVSGSDSIGGLVGHNAGAAIINSYFNKETSRQSDSTKGIAKTSAEMKQKSTFAGWDTTSIWKINNNYPELIIFDRKE